MEQMQPKDCSIGVELVLLAPPPQSPKNFKMNRSKPATILVVDDEPDHCELIRRILLREGYIIHTATDGLRCTVGITDRTDLIVMDLSMPVLDGLSAAEQIRRHPKLGNVPIIFVSAFGAKAMDLFAGLDALGSGPIEYLPKPLFEVEQLVDLACELLKRTTGDLQPILPNPIEQ